MARLQHHSTFWSFLHQSSVVHQDTLPVDDHGAISFTKEVSLESLDFRTCFGLSSINYGKRYGTVAPPFHDLVAVACWCTWSPGQ